MALEDPIADSAIWAAGRRLAAQRVLAEEERREIERLASGHRWRGYGMLLAGPAFCLVCLAATVLVSDVELRIQLLTIGMFVGLLLLGVPLAFASRHWL